MPKKKIRNELKEARAILKPVLKAEKRLKKATDALVVAKLALAHSLVEADVSSNPTLSAWTEAVLSSDDTAAGKVSSQLLTKADKGAPAKPATELKVISARPTAATPATTVPRRKPAAKPAAKPSTTVAKTSATKPVPATKTVAPAKAATRPTRARKTPTTAPKKVDTVSP